MGHVGVRRDRRDPQDRRTSTAQPTGTISCRAHPWPTIVPRMRRLLKGRFETPREVYLWVGIFNALSVTCALIAMSILPDDTELSFLRTCVSKVGSFDAEYNPHGFLWFSAAIILAAIGMMSLVFYRHERMTAALGASLRMRILTGFYVVGVACFGLTGVIPMARDALFGSVTWDDVHDVAAKIAFLTFGTAILVEGLVILGNRNSSKRGAGLRPPYPRLILPHAWLALTGGCTIFFLLSWDVKRAADPSLRWTGEGLYSFALWEWILFLSGPLIMGAIGIIWIQTPRDDGG